MAGAPSGHRHASMTLAFAFEAFQELAEPATVFAEARGWARYVAVVGNDAAAVEAYLAEHDVEQDVALGDEDKWLALQGIHEATDTERHVFVGQTADDRRAAEQTGWEYVPLEEAADKAEWELAAASGGSPFSRLRGWLGDE